MAKKDNRFVNFLIKSIPFVIPLAIIGYVVYWNWLPFGYEKTYVLDVGSEGDTDSSRDLYLRDLTDIGRISEPMIDENGNTYRDINYATNYLYLKDKLFF